MTTIRARVLIGTGAVLLLSACGGDPSRLVATHDSGSELARYAADYAACSHAQKPRHCQTEVLTRCQEDHTFEDAFAACGDLLPPSKHGVKIDCTGFTGISLDACRKARQLEKEHLTVDEMSTPPAADR
jgi:hypothetical protein